MITDARRMEVYTGDPLEVLRDLEGFYECPKDDSGKRLGPLVGYAGRDSQGRQYVGDLYANFAVAEQHPWIYQLWGMRLSNRFPALGIDPTVLMGMPMGGILVADAIGHQRNREEFVRVIYAEKKVTALATSTSREQASLVLSRHGIHPGDRVVICEDLTNNFSTTAEASVLVQRLGGRVIAIATMLNRSAQESFTTDDGVIPVVALAHRPLPQYEQDDPAVAEDVAAGNVVWKVKVEWPRLAEAMRLYGKK